MKFCILIALSLAFVATQAKAVSSDKAQEKADDLIAKLLAQDGKENNDFIFGLVHHAIRGVVGVAHHAIGAVRGVAHHLLGDKLSEDDLLGLISQAVRGVINHAAAATAGIANHLLGDQPKEDVQVANMITDMLMKDLSNEENKDFIFGLVHHAIRGVVGVAHHAIGAVGGVAHHLLGDKAKEDFLIIPHLLLNHHLFGDEGKEDYVNKMTKDVADRLRRYPYIHPFIRPAIHLVAVCPAHHGDNKQECQLDSEDLAMELTNAMLKDSNEKAKKDFIFGLVHHAIRGVVGVAHHAIGAVRGVAHHLLGDEDKQDFTGFGIPKHLWGKPGAAKWLSRYGDKDKEDFLLGLAKHAIRGVAGVGVHHHLFGDEDKKDYEQ